MILVAFLQELLESGQITVAGQPTHFEPDDQQQAVAVLQRFYDEDRLHLPHAAPPFSPEAALWGAQFLYYAVQLTLLRELDETAVTHYLTDFPEPIAPPAIYSADLTLRYLPDLLGLAKGLAPADVLVTRLLEIARQWPFSFVGVEIPEPVLLAPILADPALRTAYIDHVIRVRDQPRARHPEVNELIQQALGGYATEFWPDFTPVSMAEK